MITKNTIESRKPKIFLFCEATGRGTGAVHGSTPNGDVIGSALAEDGTFLAQHLSSSVDFSKHDLGFTSSQKHELYNAHYPQGFELVWIDENQLDGHDGFQAAWQRANAATSAQARLVSSLIG